MRDYNKDKKGWVTFKGNRKKKKLRVYISEFSKTLSTVGKKNYKYYRELLIYYYNKDGLEGIYTAYVTSLEDIVAQSKKE